MTDADTSPDSLAKRIFLFLIFGVIVYVTSIFILIASPEEQTTDSAHTPALALARHP